MKRCKMGRINRGYILELPLHLLFDILSMLTIETIFSCKCVCKTFLEILTDPHFIEHLTTSPNTDNGLIIHDRRNISNFLLVYNNELGKPNSDKANCGSSPCQTLAVPTNVSHNYNFTVYIVGSYNGLLCLRYSSAKLYHKYYICNPILGEFFALPPLLVQHTKNIDHGAFGFCLKTKQYKVVRFITSSICSIYTLGTNHWRPAKAPYPRSLGSFDSSLNGNLHWITKTTKLSNLICCFNLETEQFSYISSPLHLNPHDLMFMYLKLGLLCGLFCFNFCFGSKYEAFVMKDYGPEGCWTKMFSVDLSSSSFNMKGLLRECLNNGDLVLKRDFHTLTYCDIRKRTIGYMIAENNFGSCGAISFVPSFISLKDLTGVAVGNVEVVQRKMGRNLWTENGFKFIR